MQVPLIRIVPSAVYMECSIMMVSLSPLSLFLYLPLSLPASLSLSLSPPLSPRLSLLLSLFSPLLIDLTDPENENFVVNPQDQEGELDNMIVFECQYNPLGSTRFVRWEFYRQGGARLSISSNFSFP